MNELSACRRVLPLQDARGHGPQIVHIATNSRKHFGMSMVQMEVIVVGEEIHPNAVGNMSLLAHPIRLASFSQLWLWLIHVERFYGLVWVVEVLAARRR